MSRLFALCLAVLFAIGLSAGVPDTWAQGKGKAEPKAETKKADDKAEAKKKKGPIDINAASPDELQTLPGIGDALSKKIVENRPYTRKDELVKKNIIPQATYDKIKDQIIAHQVKAKEKTAEKPKEKK